MATVLVLRPSREDFELGPEAAGRLARVGVTGITVLRDRRDVAVVLEGCAFDPVASAAVVAEALGGGRRSRTLHMVMQSSLHDVRDGSVRVDR